MSTGDELSLERSQRLILDSVGLSADLVLVACGRLVADELSVAGAHELLSGTTYRQIGLDELSKARGEVALLLGGGFSRNDHEIMPRALAIAELRFQRVIVLPTSFDPSDETVHGALARSGATIFAREPDSLRQIAELCDARLAHDCSFFFDFASYRRTGSGALNAFGAPPSGSADNDDISVTAPDLAEWLELVASHETVRTDRAQVMIAAALMGKRVEYASGAEPGLESIARHALSDRAVTPIAPATGPQPLVSASFGPGTDATVRQLRDAALAAEPPSRESTARVTAVVLTRDRPQVLLRALESVEDSGVAVHTLVIDNNSAPAAARDVAAICEARANTELKRSERNLGCAGGRRLGIELADSEFVLFLDDDAELMPGAIDHLLLELERNPDAGAVTATVVRSDGTVLHSGGGMEVTGEIVTFELQCDGVPFSTATVPASGPSGWAPGGAMLARRELLAEFPFDEKMGAYFEDNEWSYRVWRARPNCFRRSREALVVHPVNPKHVPAADFATRSRMVELLASYARFYESHGRLLGPWLFDHVPELRAEDGSLDLPAARLLMELVRAKGADWTLMSWMNGDLEGLLTANRRLVRLEVAEAALGREKVMVEQLRARAGQDAATIARLDERVQRVERSVTWQLFERVRARTFALLGGERSRAVGLLQRTLRLLGRLLLRGRSAARSHGRSLWVPGRRTGPIHLPESSDPHVSIVMPLHSHARLTDSALRSVVENTAGLSYEVILVDDSEDRPTKALLDRVHGAHVLVNDSNLGYLRSMKRGAEAARGRWLVLCNNDIEVQPGWLAALLDCGESRPDVAAVAPKFIYPDGTLAEAGGIVWRDGTGANYGRGEDPDVCHYQYRREVDYGSAAALMVRADFWREVGGFDDLFLPMYYEDTDLCFEARRRGLRVVYEPRAEVVHVEGATAGVDESAGHKRHQEQNRPKFVAKWRQTLEAEHLASERASLWIAANRLRPRRVLVVDHRVPTWDRDSGGLRMKGMLEALVGLGCHVSLLPDNMLPAQPYTRELQQLGVEVLYGSSDALVELARIGSGLSLVILSRAQVANRWLELVRAHTSTAPVVFDTVDLHWLREARGAGIAGNGASLPANVAAMRDLELSLIRATDATLVVTEEERAQVLADVPGARVRVVPNVHLLREPVAPPGPRRGVLFVGGFEHPPNVDGALTLVHDVMPLVWRARDDVSVKVVGADAPDSVQALASGRVELVGWVHDLDPVLDASRVLVAPLTYGAGMKGKVTQALASGLPVVTTPIGAEGLGAVDGEHMLIGETPEELAERVLRVLADDELWRRLSVAGQRLVAGRCSPEVTSRRLAELMEELSADRPPAQPAVAH